MDSSFITETNRHGFLSSSRVTKVDKMIYRLRPTPKKAPVLRPAAIGDQRIPINKEDKKSGRGAIRKTDKGQEIKGIKVNSPGLLRPFPRT
ncbi:unnamed protein product [Nezara viridula]|uniref:Uncharacterized protein n=1 Tax=Nezara viridula TaxID=85310 RepID=A0A9P0HSV5_NEZVI|nr:unnamed protein product [Nezara viridula]